MEALLVGGPACVVARKAVVALFGATPARTVSDADIDLAIAAVQTEGLPVTEERWAEIRKDLVQFADACRRVHNSVAFWPEPAVWNGLIGFEYQSEAVRFARHICYRKVVEMLENGTPIAEMSLDDLFAAVNTVRQACEAGQEGFHRLEFHRMTPHHFQEMGEFLLLKVHGAQLRHDMATTTFPVAMPD